MFAKILDCPECNHRFNFDHENDSLPERITCPGCGQSHRSADYSALVLCQSCNTKLQIPLEMINDNDLVCPKCGVTLELNSSLLGKDVEDITTYADTGSSSQTYKRMLQDGSIFDKYRIIRLLGKGGMAEVYLAEHVLLKQKCALKLMRSNMNSDDPITIKRFLREAKLTHTLNHPNIVKVHDAGSDFKTGLLFIAMEYVEGKTLQDIAKSRQLSEAELCEVLDSMAQALKALAEARIVHRDIKPSNIMLDNSGVYKLMDLGIAKSESNHQAGEMTLTMEQSTIGTPNYASPEQCKSSHNVDIRSDIYSLGTTIYHAASGKLPFDGNTVVETIVNVLHKDPDPLKKYRPDLSGKFLELIGDMMKKSPDERPASPDALLAALNAGERTAAGNAMHKLQRGAKTFLRSFLPSAYASRKRYFLRQVIYLGSVVFIALLAVNLLFMSKRNSKQPVVAGNEAKTSVQEQPQIKTTATVEPQNRPALKKQPAITAADGLPIAPANTADWKKSPLDGSWHICYDEAIKEASANNKPLFIVFAADEKPEKGNSFYNKYFNSIFTVMSPNFEREEAVWLYVGSKQDTDAPEVQQQYNSQLKQHFINDMRMMPQNRGVLLSLYPDGKQISEPLLMAIDIAKLRAKLRSDYRSFKNNYNK